MIGHSIGEYAAAACCGVLKVGDALRMVATRARVMVEECERSAMLSAVLPLEEAREYAAAHEGLWVACENSPKNVVFSGTFSAVDAALAELTERGVRSSKLRVTHGFHSPLVAPAAEAVRDIARSVELGAPKVPMTSNVHGGWMRHEGSLEAADTWAQHVVGTIRFVDNVETVLKWTPNVIVEVGPGSTLCSLIGKCVAGSPSGSPPPMTVQAMRHPKATGVHDAECLAGTLGKLFQAGVPIDWQRYHAADRRQRVPVPSYAFERVSHWINPRASIYVEPKDSDPFPSASGGFGAPEAGGSAGAAAAAAPPLSEVLVRYGEGGGGGAPRAVVYCLPFAGGTSQIFAEVARSEELRRCGVELVAVELAGRGARSSDERSGDEAGDALQLARVAAAVRADAEARPGVPFALLGLSMGALLAIELADVLRDLSPLHLFLAGRCPVLPDPAAGAAAASAELSEADVEALNLAPAEMRASEAWATYFEPMLNADLAADARAAGRVVALQERGLGLSMGVDVFCGLADASFPAARASEWAAISKSDDCDTHFFGGGHDFLTRCLAQIFRRACGVLTAALGAVPAAVAGAAPGAEAASPLYAVRWDCIGTGEAEPAADDEAAEAPLTLAVGTEELVLGEEHVRKLSSGALVLDLAALSAGGEEECAGGDEEAWHGRDSAQASPAPLAFS